MSAIAFKRSFFIVVRVYVFKCRIAENERSQVHDVTGTVPNILNIYIKSVASRSFYGSEHSLFQSAPYVKTFSNVSNVSRFHIENNEFTCDGANFL